MPAVLSPLISRRTARAIGTDRELALRLLPLVRRRYGRSYRLRALLFVLATLPGLAPLLPRGPRERVLRAFLGPMLNPPRASRAYVTGRVAPLDDPCATLEAP